MMNRNQRICQIINTRLADLKLDDDLASRILNKSSKPKLIKKPLAVAIAFCLCLVLSVPIMAATIPSFNRLLSLLSPELAQMLQPVALVSESNGIKMEVIAAMNDDDTAVVYLTMQDLSGDRIDRQISLDHYSISEGNLFTSEVIAYDEKTKTATIRLLANGGSRLNGQKITVSVNSFLSGKHEYHDVPTGIDWAAVQEAPQTIPLDMEKNVRGGGGELFQQLRAQGTVQVLQPDVMNIRLPGIDFAHISNVGMVDGRLHVQMKWTGNGFDNHGYVYLEDVSGNIIHPSNFSFGRDAFGNAIYGNEYEEDIFDIDARRLSAFKLKGYFVTSDSYVQGNWRTTFKIEAVKQFKQADCYIETGNMVITRVSVSPLGLTILGKGPAQKSDFLDVSLTVMDGGVQKFTTTSSFNDSGNITRKYMPDLPLDVEKVRQVSINGNAVQFSN